MKMQLFGNDVSFFRHRVSQCLIIDFLLLAIYWHWFKPFWGLPMGKFS